MYLDTAGELAMRWRAGASEGWMGRRCRVGRVMVTGGRSEVVVVVAGGGAC